MHREDLLSAGDLASRSAVTLGEFWPQEGEGPGPKAGSFPSPHMVLGGELPWELGGPGGPKEPSPGPLPTVGLWAVFWLGSAPTPFF